MSKHVTYMISIFKTVHENHRFRSNLMRCTESMFSWSKVYAVVVKVIDFTALKQSTISMLM